MRNRKIFEELEEKNLAPYAMKSKYSKGRRYKESGHDYRSEFQRDRDRIIHCSAFRKLEYKTQVFVIHEGDYYRTRLTHTIEASQIARTISRALSLNEDLTEAIVLAHDLGHTPFGHSGEAVLEELMLDFGGFEHNRQSLRIVDILEKRYPCFPGLNLTWEVREGISKHHSEYDNSLGNEFLPDERSTMEAQVANTSDEIAYNSHDIDDGLTSGLLKLDDLKKVAIFKEIYKKNKDKQYKMDFNIVKSQFVKSLINIQCTDLINQTEINLKKYHIHSFKDVRQSDSDIVGFSPEMDKKNKELKEFLLKFLYKNYKVVRMEEKAQRFIRDLFRIYLSRFDSLPLEVQKLKTEEISKERIVCDYIAGMTDRFALEEYKKLTDPFERV